MSATTTTSELDRADADERRLQSVCSHEAGHEIVAVNLGLKAETLVASLGAGVCCHDPPPNDRAAAAIGFAGVLAEDLMGLRSERRTLPQAPLSPETLDAYCAELLSAAGTKQLSTADWRAICTDYTHAREACALAYRILTLRRDALTWRTEKLADENRERVRSVGRETAERAIAALEERWCRNVQEAEFAKWEKHTEAVLANMVPTPPGGFPATVGDFLETIVAEGKRPLTPEAVQRFNRFCLQAVRSRWGGGDARNFQAQLEVERWLMMPHLTPEHRAQCPGKTDSEIANRLVQARFEAEISQLLGQTFQHKWAWEETARAYRQWWAAQQTPQTP